MRLQHHYKRDCNRLVHEAPTFEPHVLVFVARLLPTETNDGDKIILLISTHTKLLALAI